MAIEVEVRGLERVIAAVEKIPGKTGLAARRAFINAAERTKTALIRTAADATGVPQKTLRFNRVKQRGTGGGGRLVWGGYNDISTPYIAREGELEGQINNPPDWGVKVGKFLFEGAFVRRSRSGYVGVFKNVAGKLQEQKVVVQGFVEAAEIVQREAYEALRPDVVKELETEIKDL